MPVSRSKKALEEAKETVAENRVKIGPRKLTRFERARIVGARALQISTGAPILIQLERAITNPMNIAMDELNAGILPMTVRRSLPNGASQDIPIQWLMEPEARSAR